MKYCGDAGMVACPSGGGIARFQPLQYRGPQSDDNKSSTDQHFSYDSNRNLQRIETTDEYDGISGTPHHVTLNWGTGASPIDKATLNYAEDGNLNRTNFGYDVKGNLTSITPPLPLGATTIENDALSRVRKVTDSQARWRQFAYDKQDRVTQIQFSDGKTWTYSYDANGNVTQRVEGSNTTSYAYDALNRRTDEDFPGAKSNDYTYDLAGNLASLTDGAGTVSYAYDDVNRLQSITQPGNQAINYAYAYTNGELTEAMTFPGGLTQKTTTDKSGKAKEIRVDQGATNLRRWTYTYTDAASKPTTLRQSVTEHHNAETTTYRYDTLDRLRRASAGANVYAYDYDRASNRLHKRAPGQTTSYSYNAANQLCWSKNADIATADLRCDAPPSGARPYTYDANGNLTASQTGGSDDFQATYDMRDRMLTRDGTPGSYQYLSPTQGEFTGDGGYIQNNLLGVGRLGSAYAYTREPNGALVAQRGQSGTQYVARDALGSTAGLLEGSSVVRDYDYDPDGNVVTFGTGDTTEFQYAGGHRLQGGAHASPTLYHFGRRWYDPRSARWTQVDPVDQAGDLREANRYVYAGADPVNYVDPNGLDVWDEIDEVNRDITEYADDVSDTYNNYIKRPLQTRPGRIIGRCVAGGGLLGLAARAAGGPVGVAATAGCVGYNAFYRFR